MIRIAAALTALVMASAAYADESAAIAKGQAAAMAKLNDPESARFSDVKVVTTNGRQIVCGHVNAKNRMGGYDGAKPFMFDPGLGVGAIIYGADRITDDVMSGLAQLQGYKNLCG